MISTAKTIAPTVSAVIPCFNGSQWIREAIESIRAQTVPVLEIIVVDDCSTDKSGEIAASCGAKVVRNPANSGEGYSRNRGFEAASGVFIASLDADDLWMPHHVETLVNLFRDHPSATAAFASVQRFGLRDEVIQGYIPPGEPTNVFWFAFADWVHTTIGSMVRKEALTEVGGFNEAERYAVDYDLWLRLSRHHLFVCTHEVTSLWRWHEQNQSNHLDRQIQAVYRFRQTYIAQQIARGDRDFLAEAQKQLLKIWRRDIDTAWRSRDAGLVAFLVAYASKHIEALSDFERLRWAARSLIPTSAMAVRDRLIGYDRPKRG